jgi:hypothetical protein
MAVNTSSSLRSLISFSSYFSVFGRGFWLSHEEADLLVEAVYAVEL